MGQQNVVAVNETAGKEIRDDKKTNKTSDGYRCHYPKSVHSYRVIRYIIFSRKLERIDV